MVQRKLKTIIEVTVHLGCRCSRNTTRLRNQVPLDAFFLVDVSQRATRERVVQSDLRGQQTCEAATDILCIGKCIDMIEPPEVVAQRQQPRLVEEEEVV